MKINESNKEYIFYEVLEYTAYKDVNDFSRLMIVEQSNSLEQKTKENSEFLRTQECDPLNHYIFEFEDIKLEIFASGFVIEDGFSENYLEQEKVKELL